MTAHTGDIAALRLQLLIAHPLGDLAPYFRGLRAGRAIASRCPACARTWFPPRPDCPDHRRGVDWVELPGTGRVVSVTFTETALPFGTGPAPRSFALIAMEGAENQAFGRLVTPNGSAVEGRRVWITRAAGDWPHPAQAAIYVFDEQARQTEPLP